MIEIFLHLRKQGLEKTTRVLNKRLLFNNWYSIVYVQGSHWGYYL